MNGKPQDHPITDALHYGKSCLGPECDDLIRKLSRLMPSPELHALVNWFDPPDDLASVLSDTLEKKRAEARQRGWELDEE